MITTDGTPTFRRLRAMTVLAATALLGTLGACSDDTTASAPELTELEEAALDHAVATAAAEATVDDVGAMYIDDLTGATGPTMMGGQGGQGHGQGWHQRFGQGGGMGPHDQLERERTVTFYDAAGEVMDSYDDELTATVEMSMWVSGSVERGPWSAEIERTRDLTVSGLIGQETERTFNGTGTNDVSRVRVDEENGDWTYTMTSDGTVEDVVVGVPRVDFPWPLSGTITHHVLVEVVNSPRGDFTRERDVTITFDGTQYATITVDGETWEVDLADRDGHRPRRR